MEVDYSCAIIPVNEEIWFFIMLRVILLDFKQVTRQVNRKFMSFKMGGLILDLDNFNYS